MTSQPTDRYETAAGLVARSAAAFASGVPEHPADNGFFGPSSVAWRLGTDLSAPVSGLRSLLLQALHPLAMAGVDQHSQWRQDPVGRLAATFGYVTTVTYGDRAAAEKVSAVVRRVHEHVRGTDPATGQPYDATDPALLLWVHAALVDSALAAAELVGSPPDAADADRYIAEMVAAGELVGIPRAMVPASTTELASYLESVRPELLRTPAAEDAIAHLLGSVGQDPDVAELWQDVTDAAIRSLPDWAIEMHGFTAPDIDRDNTRQALGVLDIVFMGEPGVLEARQRIETRRRAAR
ncbi:MAG: oxygenase MpaB family protein [Streptosporangiaceae bacterium]